MATVHITFRDAHSKGGASVYAKPRKAQTITSSGTSQPTTITALQNEVARIVSVGGAVFVNYAGTAASGAGDLVADGASIDVVLNAGDTVSIINA